MVAEIWEDTLVREMSKIVVEVWCLCTSISCLLSRRAVRGLRYAPSPEIRAISTCAGVTASAVILTTSPDLRYRLLTAPPLAPYWQHLISDAIGGRRRSPHEDAQTRTPSPINMSRAHVSATNHCSDTRKRNICIPRINKLYRISGKRAVNRCSDVPSFFRVPSIRLTRVV